MADLFGSVDELNKCALAIRVKEANHLTYHQRQPPALAPFYVYVMTL